MGAGEIGRNRTAMIVLAGSLAAGVGVADDTTGRTGSSREDVYGTTSDGIYTIPAYAFVPATGSGANLIANTSGSRGCSSPCILVAPVILPAGVLIHELELEACDVGAADIQAVIVRQEALEGATTPLASVTTIGLNGCSFRHNPLQPHTVDNLRSTYRVEITLNDSSLATRFQAVRLWYRLQVSPAPATATFPNDVPTTHPFFRFVEALAAAGISAGCGAGAYCPDTPVTRGQMAVFLATALGLHFPH